MSEPGSPKAIIAEIVDRIVDRPGHNMLASEIVKKLSAGGYVIVPIEPTELMQKAGWNVQPMGPVCDWDMRGIYQSMIGAFSS